MFASSSIRGGCSRIHHELGEGHGGAGVDLVVGERNMIRLSDSLVCLWEEEGSVIDVGS